MGKKFDETLLFLGSEYRKSIIDLEEVIYRDFGDFEIEISGLNRYGPYDAVIYVWKDRQIKASITGLKSKEAVLAALKTLYPEAT